MTTLQSMGDRADSDDVGREIAALAPWFHNLHLPSGHQTAPRTAATNRTDPS